MYNHGNYTSVPTLTLESLDRYAQDRLQPGGFLQSVLSNDLAGAMGRADAWNSAVLKDIVGYVYNELPSPCWGSPENYRAWLNGEDQ